MQFLICLRFLTFAFIIANLSVSDGRKSRQESKRQERDSRISGGYPAKPGEFPSFVSFIAQTGNLTTYCAGTLISDELVLTTASCVWKVKQILAATTILQQFRWIEKVGLRFYRSSRKVCWSRDYEKTALFNYGMIRLSKPVKLSSDIQPALLPEEQIKPEDEAFAIGVGFTQPGNNGTAIPEVLQALPVKLVDCKKNPLDRRICFKHYREEYKGDICSRDSGGPVLARHKDGYWWQVFGITSGSPTGECRAGHYDSSSFMDVYTNLGHIRDLMRSAMEPTNKTHNEVTCRDLDPF